MKIMYIDASIDGHHMVYLNSLLKAASGDSLAVLPEGGEVTAGRLRTIPFTTLRTLSGYRGWMNQVWRAAREEAPDIIHFLDGDSIMRYFGAGLRRFRDYKVVITFHHLFPGKLREISMKAMLKNADAGVFHTEEIKKQVRTMGCKNAECVPYPCFLKTEMGQGNGYANPEPVLLALGGTRYDKGLDILLEALKQVKTPFRLLIAGMEETFREEFIREQIKSYRERVTLCLKFLTEEEMLECLCRADIVVLPYRRVFEGASGPLCEGVYLGKTIVGPDHGSLGQAITKNHIGYTFESENVKALADCLTKALQTPCIYDKTARVMQCSLSEDGFLENYRYLYLKLTEKE